eukprot:Gb_16291 [translate_table: standard]
MAAKLMKAVQYNGYGGGAGSLQHVEVPVPTPKKGELLVKLEAASLNPIDWKIQNGVLRPLFPPKFPFIPGTDIAGEVVEVGPGVKDFKSGDRIVSMLSTKNGGGLAEYAVAPIKTTVKRPPGVSAQNGACLPIAALTALQAIRDSAGIKLDGSGKETSLLVTAASGGVGHYAVQIAKLGKTHVTATCGARNISLIKDLGADEVLEYKTPEGAALKSPSGHKYDAVIHCTSNIPWSIFQPNLSPSGKVIDLTPNFMSLASSIAKKVTLAKQRLVPFIVSGNANDLAFMVDLVKEGKIRTIIDSKHPLEKAEDAWAKSMEGHATGKIVVTFGE